MSAARRAILGAALALCLAGADQPAGTPAAPAAASTPPASPAPPPAASPPPSGTAPAQPPAPPANAAPPAEKKPAAPAPEKKAEAKPPAPQVPKNLITLNPNDVVAILGKKVRDPQGADMGPVVDVLVTPEGAPVGAVIDFGGFLGVGTRKIAIAWELLQFNPKDHDAPILLSLNRAQVQAAPEFKVSVQPLQMVGPPPPAADGPPPNGK
jgi:hypothetical protein